MKTNHNNIVSKLPKIELHCHLDGSVRAQTIIDIAKKENINIPSFDVNQINKLVRVHSDCTSLVDYLKTFDIPNRVMQSKYSLKRITFELLEDAANENIKYMEIRFAPLLHIHKGLSVDEIIESVLEGVYEAQSKYDIKANLILSCMRTMTVEDALLVINSGRKFLRKGVIATDLCGPELEGFCETFKDVMRIAKNYGYRITIHAGEGASGKNVLDAINILGAERIGHGVRINDIKIAYNAVKDNNVLLEICPTSNIQTKAVDSYDNHPLYKFYKDGLKISINTDNRTVSSINLTDELELIFDKYRLDINDYKKIYLDTVDASFADEQTKKWLRNFI